MAVGYTNTIGSLEDNITLSKARAASVIEALVSVDTNFAKQLTAFGAAYSAPKASNRQEVGRQINRRVELVEIVL